MLKLHWVPEVFLAQFPVSIISLLPLVPSTFGHRSETKNFHLPRASSLWYQGTKKQTNEQIKDVFN